MLKLKVKLLYCSKHWVPAESVLEAGISGLRLKDVKDDTKAVASRIHGRYSRVQPVVTPIYTTSTYVVEDVDHYSDILKNVNILSNK